MTRNTIQLECFWDDFAPRRHFKKSATLNKEILKVLARDSSYTSKNILKWHQTQHNMTFWENFLSMTLFWKLAIILNSKRNFECLSFLCNIRFWPSTSVQNGILLFKKFKSCYVVPILNFNCKINSAHSFL